MSLELARMIVAGAGIYLAVGLVFAIAFVSIGVGKIDSAARDGGLAFRLILVPASAALWPFLLRRWTSTDGHPPEEENAHRAAARRRDSAGAGVPS